MPRTVIKIPTPSVENPPAQDEEGDAGKAPVPGKPPGSGGSGAPAAPHGPSHEPGGTIEDGGLRVLLQPVCLQRA